MLRKLFLLQVSRAFIYFRRRRVGRWSRDCDSPLIPTLGSEPCWDPGWGALFQYLILGASLILVF